MIVCMAEPCGKFFLKNRDSRVRVNGIDKVFFRGIVKREFYSSLYSFLGTDLISIKRNRIPPIFNLISYTDELNPIVRKRFLPFFREILLASTRNPKLLFSRSWVPFTLTATFPLNDSLDFKLPSNTLLDPKVRIFTSREVARFGFHTDSLEPTLEYELRRSWDSYDVLIVCASVKFHQVKGRIPFFASSNSTRLKKKIKGIESRLGNTFFRELLEIEMPFESLNQQRYRGTVETPFRCESYTSHDSLWSHRIIEQAEILHGNTVYSRSRFFFPDGMRVPSHGSLGNVWPGYTYQDSKQVIHSPSCRTVKDPIVEAIFLGGTKNWMHFVIEDLPRIIKFDFMKIPDSAPLIISEDLGRQINQSIQKLTSRELVIAKPFEVIPVTKLHLLEFSNPLMRTMSGDKEAASQLFDPEVLNYAKQKFAQVDVKPRPISNKVLIRREKNLFRPLINADKLQKILEEKHGFHTVYLGDKDLVEVMATFRHASVVVGEYGAGLANIIFITKRSLVVEIRGGLEKNADEYRALGEALGHEYVVAHGVNRKISKFGVARGPYKIDIDKVLEILDSRLLTLQDNGSR